MTAEDPGSVPHAAAPPNTFSYIAIACGVLAFVARGRRELRWMTGLIVAVVGMVLGLLSVLLL